MKAVSAWTVLLSVVMSAAPAAAAPPAELAPLGFLLGRWDAKGGGAPGRGTGSTTFSLGLQDRVMLRSNFAEYPASAHAPASRHDDLMIIYPDARGGIGADYFDSEGHRFHYVVTTPAPGRAVFVSDVVERSPRFRLTYSLGAAGTLRGAFEIAPPGKPGNFAPYLSWESVRGATDTIPAAR